MTDREQIAVLGAGSWGTALAIHLGRAGHAVRLWARDASLAEQIATLRSNPRYLPETRLPASVASTADLVEAVRGARFVVFAVPSHGLRAVVQNTAAVVPHDAVIVS